MGELVFTSLTKEAFRSSVTARGTSPPPARHGPVVTAHGEDHWSSDDMIIWRGGKLFPADRGDHPRDSRPHGAVPAAAEEAGPHGHPRRPRRGPVRGGERLPTAPPWQAGQGAYQGVRHLRHVDVSRRAPCPLRGQGEASRRPARTKERRRVEPWLPPSRPDGRRGSVKIAHTDPATTSAAWSGCCATTSPRHVGHRGH